MSSAVYPSPRSLRTKSTVRRSPRMVGRPSQTPGVTLTRSSIVRRLGQSSGGRKRITPVATPGALQGPGARLHRLVTNSAGAMCREVAAGGRQRRMPELRLDGVHRHALERQLGGVGVPKPVRMHALLDPDAAREPGHEPAHIGARHRLPPERAEQGSETVDAEGGALVQPPLYDGERAGVEPDGTPLAALAHEHGDGASVPVQVLRVEPECLKRRTVGLDLGAFAVLERWL